MENSIRENILSNSFNQDKNIKKEFENLRDKFGIKFIIETGTFHGETTFALSEMFEKVYTIEVNENYYDISKKILQECNNVKMYAGNSFEKMKEILIGISSVYKETIMFFLDAHWYAYNPLLDELNTIAKYYKNCVIAIHDFKVPNKDFGYDKFPNGKDYEYKEIEDCLLNIYGYNNFNYYYNSEAEGANRGIIYITPKEK
jgi:hypothetical protein